MGQPQLSLYLLIWSPKVKLLWSVLWRSVVRLCVCVRACVHRRESFKLWSLSWGRCVPFMSKNPLVSDLKLCTPVSTLQHLAYTTRSYSHFIVTQNIVKLAMIYSFCSEVTKKFCNRSKNMGHFDVLNTQTVLMWRTVSFSRLSSWTQHAFASCPTHVWLTVHRFVL
jgi:hypothetical protein